MTKFGLSTILLLALMNSASGIVTTSVSAPTTDIISSNGTGGTFTRLIDEDANSNHARGQIFSLGDGAGTAYEISSVTIRKDNNQTYNNGTITLRLFEGSQTDWDAGTGHSTGTDGNDYLVDTTVTLLHTEAFNLSGTINDNDYVTFQLASPVQVSESSDLGFFLVYDQAVGDDDDFEHLEGGAGGRVSISTTNHGTSGSRSVVYYVQGIPITPAGTITTSATAPTTDIISSSATGSTDTSLFDEGADPNHARGQLFALPDGSGTSYEVSSITVKKSTDQSFVNDTLTLRIFEGNQGQWDAGTGHDTPTDGSDYYVDTTVTPLYAESYILNGTLTDNDYITFELATPITVNEDSDFGFFMTYDQGSGTEDRFQHREHTSGAGRLSIATGNHSTSGTRKVVYYVEGTPTGVPSSVLALASPFQDGMVLQRGKPICIWGQADPSTAVSVTIDGNMGNGTSEADGSWKLTLPALTAGGPHTLTVTSGSATVTLNDVLIGDVWIAFGQSNMVRPLSEMTGKQFYIDEIELNNAPVRCLKVTQFGALTPQEEATVPAGHYVNGAMNWLDASTSETWTSVGTVFAYRMYEATGVPTAIIWAAWGSSSIEGWMPAEMAEELPHFAKHMTYLSEVGNYNSDADYNNVTRANNLGFSTNAEGVASLQASGWTGATSSSDIFMRTRPNTLYNQMIHPFRNFGVSGFVWYQGEANAAAIQNAAQYGFTLPLFVKEYRKRFDQGDLPFLAVQLPSFNQVNWPWFRESQNRISSEPNTHVAVTIDTGLSGNIHPTDKEPIGVRLAGLARKYVYGESIEAEGPTFASMNISGNQATISFTHGAGLTTDNGQSPTEFELAGADMVFHATTSASISGGDVIISSTSEPAPVAVRYAWSPTPVNQVNLVNGDDLPAAPFRTDSWPVTGLGAQAPQSVNDSYELDRDQVLNVPVSGVLENDIDLNGDSLTAALIEDVSFGSLTLFSDGSFNYTPESGYAGPDSFTYQCSDGGLTSPVATVSILVNGASSYYYLWRSGIGWGPGDDESETGDPDLDGVANLLEFALGMNPVVSSTSGLPTLSLGGSDAVYDFNNAQAGITYEVLLSTDLETWIEPPFAVLTSESATPVLIPMSESVDGRLFVRLRVSE